LSSVQRVRNGLRETQVRSQTHCTHISPAIHHLHYRLKGINNAQTAITMFSLRSALPRAGARAFSTTTPRALAKMQLIGRLAETPSVNPTSTGRDVIRYALGVSTGSKDENGNRGVSWFKVASFSEGPQKDLLLSLPKG
jgi:hypothetical protein